MLEAAALALEAEAIAEHDHDNPPIRITAFDHTAVGNIGQVVADFVDKNPRVTFEFIVSERILDLINGDADIALRISPVINDDGLIAQKVGQTQWTYYASRRYAEKNGIPEAFAEDMGPYRVVLLNHITTRRRDVLRCANADDLRTAISTGQGIGPLTILEGDRDPNLVRCFDPPEGSEMSVWLITSLEAYKRADVRRFTAFAGPLISRNLREILK